MCRSTRLATAMGVAVCLLVIWQVAAGKAPSADRGKGPGRWQRHLVDRLPQRAVFIEAGDLDGDGRKDLVAGGWWWKSPERLAGSWRRHTIGPPLRNMTTVDDFDGDGDLDVLGTEGVGSQSNHSHVWARNNGKGKFTVLSNIETGGNGDFLQGRAIIGLGTVKLVALSWHNGGGGLQALRVPGKPSETTWPFSTLSRTTEKEDLSVGDIDRDGDPDILLGTTWLRNDVGPAARARGKRPWTPVTLGAVTRGEADRVDLADVNGDGRLDAVIGLENGTDVLWFEAPADPTRRWTRHLIGRIAGQGFSMDTADLDGDGDPDVVLGEHRGKAVNRVVIFQNLNNGTAWQEQVIDSGPTNQIDHHDGTQAVDLDGDGDLDVISIGWYNPKVWVYEQK